MKLTARDRLVVVGKTGTGKSNWTKGLCKELMGSHRLVVFDVCDEYSQLGQKTAHVRLGPLPQRCTVKELENDPRKWLDREDLALAVVSTGDPKDVATDFVTVAEFLHSTGDALFVVEEVGYFAEHCQERLKAVATMYRHVGVTAVFVAQRATQIPLTARSQASCLVAFRQDESADLKALAERIDQDFADRVSRLPVGEHALWRDDLHKEISK